MLTSYVGDGNRDDDDGVGGVDCEVQLIMNQRPAHRRSFFFSCFLPFLLSKLLSSFLSIIRC